MDKINTTTDGWWPNIDKCIADGVIRSFGTQKDAIETAQKYGWGRRIIQVSRRYERIYIVGTIDFQPSNEGGIEFTTMRVPMLRYDTGDDGVKYQPVVQFRKSYCGS